MKEDTNKIFTLQKLSYRLKLIKPDTSLILAEQALTLSQKLRFHKGITSSYSIVGFTHYNSGNYIKALENYHYLLNVYETVFHSEPNAKLRSLAKNDIAGTNDRIGLVYLEQGNQPKALDHFLKALKLSEEFLSTSIDESDKKTARKQIARTLGNIGVVYDDQNNYTKALDQYFQAFKMAEIIGDVGLQAGNLGNIGSIYHDLGDHRKALDHYSKALKIAEAIDEKNRMAIVLTYIGFLYDELGTKGRQNPRPTDTCSPSLYFKSALDCYLKALKFAEENKNKNRIAAVLGKLGALHIRIGKFNEAEAYLKKATLIGKAIGDNDGMQKFEYHLYALYDTIRKYELAFEHFKLYVAYSDSLKNEENTKKQTRLEMQYEFDKIQMTDSIKNTEHIHQENLKHEQKIKQQQTYTYGGVIGFLLMIVVTGISFRAFKQKQKANEIILFQKNLVEEKQKEILDSIHYAKRIQKSLLPTEKYIERNLRRKC